MESSVAPATASSGQVVVCARWNMLKLTCYPDNDNDNGSRKHTHNDWSTGTRSPQGPLMFHRATLALVLFIVLPALTSAAPVNVTTWRYDNTRAGENINETVLTPANVRSATFGKVFATYSYERP